MDAKPLKILIVDDEEALRESTASILELYGYEIKTASCGNEAIELVKQETFDMLFSDMRMPDITGTDVIRAVKQIQPDLICVIMTAYALNELIVEALKLGANFCLTKPFEIETMLNIITELSKQPFVVVIDEQKNISENFISNLKQDGLNTVFIEKTTCNVDFLKNHIPDALIIGVDNQDDQSVLATIQKIKTFGDKSFKTVLIGSKQAEGFINTLEQSDINSVSFVERPADINKIFYLITGKTKKFNIASIDMQEINFKQIFPEDKYNVFEYETQQNFLDELKNNFFDIIVVNVHNKDIISDFHKQFHQLMPNEKILYLADSADMLNFLETNTYYSLIKPYLPQQLFEEVNKIIGGSNGK